MKIKKMLLMFMLVFSFTILSSNLVSAATSKVYVSSTGDDATGDGTQANPYKTLVKAYQEVEDNGEILVLSDLEVDSLLRVGNKNVTLKSEGGKHRITRAVNFNPASDNRRSWYNPSMFELAGEKPTQFTIESLILDDVSRFTSKVHEAIISTYNHQGLLVLKDVDLVNTGGFEYLHLSGGNTNFESGSISETNQNYGSTFVKMHTGVLNVGENVEITNKKGGCGFVVNNSTVNFAGTIKNNDFSINPATTDGCGQAFNIGTANINLLPTSKLINNTGTLHSLIYTRDASNIVMSGEISGNENLKGPGVAAYLRDGSTLTIEDGAIIKDNRHSKTNNRGAGSAIYASFGSVVTMNGGLIENNNGDIERSFLDYFFSKNIHYGGAIAIVRNAKFTMNGGIIRNNISSSFGGGISLYTGDLDNNSIVLNAGTIENNVVTDTISSDYAGKGNDIGIFPSKDGKYYGYRNGQKVFISKNVKLKDGLFNGHTTVKNIDIDLDHGLVKDSAAMGLKALLEADPEITAANVKANDLAWVHLLEDNTNSASFLIKPFENYDVSKDEVFAAFAKVDLDTGELLTNDFEGIQITEIIDGKLKIKLPAAALKDDAYAIMLYRKDKKVVTPPVTPINPVNPTPINPVTTKEVNALPKTGTALNTGLVLLGVGILVAGAYIAVKAYQNQECKKIESKQD